MKILKIFGCIVGIVLIMYLAVDFYIVKVYKDPVVSSLPGYADKVFYEGSGTKGFTDYGKYFYEETVDLSHNEYFKKVKDSDIRDIEEYINAYMERVKNEYFYKDFDFSKKIIDENDYFFISNNENKESYKIHKNKLDAFDIYFFDTKTDTLYFMHSNI